MIRVACVLFPLAFVYQWVAGRLYTVTLTGVGSVTPDLLLVATAACSVRCRTTRGALVPALLLGLFTDLMSADPFLTRTLGLTLAALVGSGSGRHGLAENRFGNLAYYVCASGVGALVTAGWLFATGFERLIPSWKIAISAWGYNAVLGFALLGLLEPFGRCSRRAQGSRRTVQGGLEWYAGA